jgi:hypothetical protein
MTMMVVLKCTWRDPWKIGAFNVVGAYVQNNIATDQNAERTFDFRCYGDKTSCDYVTVNPIINRDNGRNSVSLHGDAKLVGPDIKNIFYEAFVLTAYQHCIALKFQCCVQQRNENQ